MSQLSLSASFEYQCYGSTTTINMLISTVLQMSDSEAKVDSRAVRTVFNCNIYFICMTLFNCIYCFVRFDLD